MPAKPCSYMVLEGKYVLHQTLGTGGFAKVKLATHVLTGEKVAIKIMDKASLGDDLPRVQLEIEALKILNHPNICKLYQVIETENKFFLILEYCPGGELFDYIIERDRVTEKEARVFFRQIISAVSYIHGKGYAHRDLKPENLLLDGEHNLKLIDFGLCAKPKTGMQEQLDTCCGSPAYAAPELITGDNYNGNKVDIWSMGVLLYALLCGFLPFDDENVTKLYKKIQKGRYFCPSWLSSESKAVLSDMLQVNPARRISIEDLKVHPWVLKECDIQTQWHCQKQIEEYDPDCLAELAVYHKRPMRSIEISLNQCKFDYLAASYCLLLSKKAAGKHFSLMQPTVLRESKCSINLSSIFDTSPVSKRVSMDSLVNSELLKLGSPQKNFQAPAFISKASSPVFVVPKDISDKENFVLPKVPSAKKYKRSSSKSSSKASSKSIVCENYSSSSKSIACENYSSSSKPNTCENYVLHSPKPLGFSASLDTAVNQVGSCLSTPLSLAADKRARSFESPPVVSITPKRRPPRHLGSSAKKVFGSIEKGLESMRNLLTPKKRMCGISLPRQVKNLCNVSATNDKVTPEEVLESLQNALLRKGIPCKQKGYTLRGKICEGKRIRLRFELEVCQLPKHQYAVGVRRKRLEGDAWYYKKICEEVLRLALLDTSVATTDV